MEMKKSSHLYIISLLFLVFIPGKLMGQLERVFHEEVAVGPIGGIPAGYSVYRIYAELSDANYRVDNILSKAYPNYNHRLILGSCSDTPVIWNSEFGGLTASELNCDAVNVIADAQYDSYIALQNTLVCNDFATVTSSDVLREFYSGLITAPFGETYTGSGSQTTNGGAVFGNSPIAPDSNNNVLIAQLTIPTGTLVYALNLRISNVTNYYSALFVHNLDDPARPALEVDGSSLGLTFGFSDCTFCNDAEACNYNVNAETSAFCEYNSCIGCDDPIACNYAPNSELLGSLNCEYCDCSLICGCMDPEAENYNPLATHQGEECVFPLSNIVINEMKFNSTTATFFELYNAGSEAVDLSGFMLKKLNPNYLSTFTFSAGTSIAVGEYIIVTPITTGFVGTYQKFIWTGYVNNSGDNRYELLDDHGQRLDYVFTYNTEDNWPTNLSQGAQLKNPALNSLLSDNWCLGGTSTPGAVNSCFSTTITGCMDQFAFNFEPLATVSGVCNYFNSKGTCATAVPIVCGTRYDGNLDLGASNDNLDSGASSCGFNPIGRQNWYYYDSSADGMVDLNLCEIAATTSLNIQVYIGECGELYCYDYSNTPYCSSGSVPQLSFYAQAGEKYYIRISNNAYGSTGTYRLLATCASTEVSCNVPGACNYSPDATNDLGCDFLSCKGCTDPSALNYEMFATIDNGSCYSAPPRIVINEFTNSDVAQNYAFVELYNAEDFDVNMSGWHLEGLDRHNFPEGFVMPAHSYVVLQNSNFAHNLTSNIFTNFNVQSVVFGNGSDFSEGNDMVLKDKFNTLIDSVPSINNTTDYAIQLINPFLDNSYMANWKVIGNSTYFNFTAGKQNSVFDPLGLTCQDSTACNYNPFIESSLSHCDYTCFWPNPFTEHDASNDPRELFDGSSFYIPRYHVASGVSLSDESCVDSYHDVWFSLNTLDYETVNVDFESNSNLQYGINIYEKIGNSLHELSCSTYSGTWNIDFSSLPNFAPNKIYYFSLYMTVSACQNCFTQGVDLHAVFTRANCMDVQACNYNSEAVIDDGSCDYDSCFGCLDNSACNYSALATIEDGSCCYSGCINISMSPGTGENDIQWRILTTDSVEVDSGSYIAFKTVCLPEDCFILELSSSNGLGWQGGLISVLQGQQYIIGNASVYQADTIYYPGCINPNIQIPGCTDPTKCNYNPLATLNNGTCLDVCVGCTDEFAMNYNSAANEENGSCVYPSGAGIYCDSPIQFFCGGEPFTFYTYNVPSDSNSPDNVYLQCPSSLVMPQGQYWFLYGSESYSLVKINTTTSGCAHVASTSVYTGECGSFECVDIFLVNGVKAFYAVPGEYYHIRIGSTSYSCAAPGITASLTCTPVISGCTDDLACNYNVNAVVDNGGCDFSCFYGCTNSIACNYNGEAVFDDGSCFYNCTYGCIDETACNFEPWANLDGGNCLYLEDCAEGCTDENACNYNSSAVFEDGSCVYDCLFGCIQSTACNYDFQAIYNDGSCDFSCFEFGCTDLLACNYNPISTQDDGTCLYEGCVFGCTQPEACNYDPLANSNDFSCIYGCIFGCTDVLACNYNPESNFEDGSCVLPGCLDVNAVNYSPVILCEGICYYYCQSDLDLNGIVDIADFLLLINNYGCIGNCDEYDIDGNGVVGAGDLQIVMFEFGVNCFQE